MIKINFIFRRNQVAFEVVKVLKKRLPTMDSNDIPHAAVICLTFDSNDEKLATVLEDCILGDEEGKA